MALDLLRDALVPSEDARMRREPAFLGAVDLLNAATCMSRDGLSFPEIVRRMAEDLGEFPLMLSRAAMIRILGMRFNEFFKWRRFDIVYTVGVE